MDGAPAGAESLWPSVIRWKPWDETGISWDFMDGVKLPPQGSVYLVSSFFFFPLSLFLIMFFFFLALTLFLGLFFSLFFLFLEITHLCIMHRVHTSITYFLITNP